ncbi:uncharacterized protein HMPREF1541_05804 [Cyphellophora europaea CBS 101466]|uniref:Major facilitator superfamily (MFS) profile domain-containing protein n=1 Tax=Cyphellophora europaea (strain CBS 101466) TaxID=1220924 RepID=W2RUY7_CYPE1|nr:uncharacterized protein HMPREF1541_05804 [Cyphellophora europaea CBS 101466]ETN39578.1 hypothetical protein HMPREF1541_05804 [Cyphellophora europaea CBS 101466]
MSKFLKTVVRNDAMKEDPPEIYGWRVYALAVSACFGGMIFGIDTGTIGGVLRMPEFQAEYGLDNISADARANLSANIVSTLQAGCFLGAIVSAYIADRWGRRPILLWAALISIVGVVLQAAAAGHLGPMYVGRFLAGVGTGHASFANPLYISENAPRAIRGGLTGLYQLAIVFGIFISFWINYGSLLHLSGASTYVVPLAMQALPCVALLVCMFFCPETPRFLAKQDKWEEARTILARLRNLPADHPYVAREFTDIQMAIEAENRLLDGSNWWALQKEMWLIPANRKRILISITLMVFQQMTGTNAINYYAPQIFSNLGVTGSQNELFATGIYGLVKLIGVAVFLVFVADSLGRRRSLIWTGIAQALAMLYIGIYVRVKQPQPGEAVDGAGYFALVCIFLFALFFQFGWGPVCWIYVSEIATARLRATNVSAAAATQWLFNFVVSRAVPPMLENMGVGGFGTYIFFASFCFTMALFVWFFLPETKGLSLEAMNELFGLPGVGAKDVENGSEHGGGETRKGSDVKEAEVDQIERRT